MEARLEIILIRHGQASFGAANYDKLSPLGHEQSIALGQVLGGLEKKPDAVFIGAQVRHKETFEGIAQGIDFDPSQAIVHPGLNEFPFDGLIKARLNGGSVSEEVKADRQAYFRMLKHTVLDWQEGRINQPPESWADFVARTQAAVEAMRETGLERIYAVSSGGPVSQVVRAALNLPAPAMIELQLQMKNCAISRLMVGKSVKVHSFNETPHINSGASAHLATYS
jgi:broad specificity phosphatase PhoE